MIKIIAKEYSQTVSYLCDKLDGEVTKYDLFLSKDSDSVTHFIADSIGCSAIVMIDVVGDSCALFAGTFGLSMFYDKFAERNVREFCKVSNIQLPPQHAMDKICIAPESFTHYASTHSVQCACYGEYRKTHVYMIPDDARECAVIYENYLRKDLFRNSLGVSRYTYKVFGLSNRAVNERLAQLGKYVSRKCETSNLDTKIVLSFAPKCAKNIISETLDKFNELFGEFIYATADQSLAKTVVDLLNRIGKTISVAESITGGMISSSIVDIAGSSKVFYEGLVTYSIPSKCSRLEISPHFVDEFGVVSQQVAQEMVKGLLKNGGDLAVSTTGYAGPTSENGLPVGLCFIGIGTPKGISVYRNIFSGGRNFVRAQATNMALFLVYKTIAK